MSRVLGYHAHLCEHHRDGLAPMLSYDDNLPEPWMIAECPECGYWAEYSADTGEVRPA